MTPTLSKLDIGSYAVFYRAGTVDRDVLNASFDSDIFYPAIPEYKGSSGHTIIDVGAHIGTFSIHSLVAQMGGKIIALEPNRESFEILSKNIDTNGFSEKIIALPYALSNKNGIEKLYLDAENWGHSLTNKELTSFEEVPCITLGSLLEEQGIQVCDLIKFNCEGAEFQIILSLDENTLKGIKMMLILFHEDLVKGTNRKNLTEFLTRHGFLVRTAFESADRGWIIAKNEVYYNSFSHRLIQLRTAIQTGTKKKMETLTRYLADTNLWRYVKRIRRKT